MPSELMGVVDIVDEENILNLHREFYKIPEKEIRELYKSKNEELASEDPFAAYRAVRNILTSRKIGNN